MLIFNQKYSAAKFPLSGAVEVQLVWIFSLGRCQLLRKMSPPGKLKLILNSSHVMCLQDTSCKSPLTTTLDRLSLGFENSTLGPLQLCPACLTSWLAVHRAPGTSSAPPAALLARPPSRAAAPARPSPAAPGQSPPTRPTPSPATPGTKS